MFKQIYNEYEVPVEDAREDLKHIASMISAIIVSLHDKGWSYNDIELNLIQEVGGVCAHKRIQAALKLHKEKK